MGGFNKAWLENNDVKSWIKYDADKEAIFCTKCLLFQAKSLQSNFNSKGYKGGKAGMVLKDLKDHAKSVKHLQVLQNIQQKSALAIGIQNMQDKEKRKLTELEEIDKDSWYPYSMLLSYFLAKNDLPFYLMEDLSWLTQNMIKISSGKEFAKKAGDYGSYSTDVAAREMVGIISKTIGTSTFDEIRNNYFTLTIDESTDVSSCKNLVMMVRYAKDGIISTKFLNLLMVKDGTAVVITEAIKEYFSKYDISFSKLIGFSSDGASVMTGRRNGVATKLKELNSCMIDTHCAAHKLQLAIEDSTQDLEKFYIGIVKSTSLYFSNSSTRKLALKKMCEDLDESFYKILRTVDTRWLSLGNSLKNLMKVYTPLKLLFREDNDSKLAETLLPHYENLGFYYWIAFMDDLCSALNGLSKRLQESNLLVCDLLPSIVLAVERINENFIQRTIAEPPKTKSLKVYYDAVSANDFTTSQLNMHLDCIAFAKRVVENIGHRFPDDSKKVIGSLSYLYPLKIYNETDKNATIDAIALLGRHYGSLLDTSDIFDQYEMWKSIVKSSIGLKNSKEFLFLVYNSPVKQQLLEEVPIIGTLLQISITLSPGSVDCERGFSLQNIIKTKLRNSLSVETTADLMRCSRDGEPIQTFDWATNLCSFMEAKKRKYE
jgi:hypothetical protein